LPDDDKFSPSVTLERIEGIRNSTSVAIPADRVHGELPARKITAMISNWWHQALTRKVKTFRRDQRDVRRHRFRPVLELLEDRRLMATITVTNLLDDTGAKSNGVSLREAIQSINLGSDANDVVAVGTYGTDDTIIFKISAGNTITLAAELPVIFKQVVIDGTNLSALGGKIEIDGTNVTGNGLTLTSSGSGDDASDSIIRDLVINNFQGDGILTGHGILIDRGITGVRIENNFIGTDVTGKQDFGNAGHGVYIRAGSGNTIGGTKVGQGNLISGNDGNGVLIEDDNANDLFSANANVVVGNYIGTKVGGLDALGNSANGVEIRSISNFTAEGNKIGLGPVVGILGTEAFGGNLISGNAAHGILLTGDGVHDNRISGNFIGTDRTGTTTTAPNGTDRLGNGANGVQLDGSDDNIITGNLISGNGDFSSSGSGLGDGINLLRSAGNTIQGNFIGVNRTGAGALPNAKNGVTVESGQDNLIGGAGKPPPSLLGIGLGNLISGNGEHGIEIEGSGATGNLVQGNFIGTALNGKDLLSNAQNGVYLYEGASSNIIGGSRLDGLGNLISGNGANGVFIDGSGIVPAPTRFNVVQGNFIGTDILGNQDKGNVGHGVEINNGAGDNTIGGFAFLGLGNLISGNGGDGVLIANDLGGGRSRNRVQGNLIGVRINGISALGNDLNGIEIRSGDSFNTIGGFTGQGNTIGFNTLTGVVVGSDLDSKSKNLDDTATGNFITGNSIFSNGLLGIDLANDGPTLNDTEDNDSGPNGLQNFPELTSVVQVGNLIIVTFTLDSLPPTLGISYSFEFFLSTEEDSIEYPDGTFGEGQRQVFGTLTLDPNPNGIHQFSFDAALVGSAKFLTATASQISDSTISTSEFSKVLDIPFIPDIPPDDEPPDDDPPGGDPIVVRIVQGELPPEVLPIFVVALQEFTVSDLPPPPTLQQVKVLPTLVRDVFENLVDAPGEIHGQILDDPNALGKVGPDTYPLHGQPVYIDFNRNGEYDDGEPLTVTNAKGEYTFTSLTAGQYTVHLVLGRTQDVTFAPKQDNKIELRSGNMIVTNVNFGVRFRARRRPGGGSALPWHSDGVLLAAGSETPSLPVAVEYGVDSLPLGQGQPAPPLPMEEPAAVEGDAPASGFFRWCGWLLGAALLAPWQQLAHRRPAARRDQRAQ